MSHGLENMKWSLRKYNKNPIKYNSLRADSVIKFIGYLVTASNSLRLILFRVKTQVDLQFIATCCKESFEKRNKESWAGFM